jgi:hypothetical protein
MAHIGIANIVAFSAKYNIYTHFKQRLGQVLRLVSGLLEQVQCKPKGSAFAYARQL